MAIPDHNDTNDTDNTSKLFAIIVGGLLAVLAVGAGIGGTMGWVGGQVLDEAGFELDDAYDFGYVGLIGGAEVALALSPAFLKSEMGLTSSTENTSFAPYFFLGLAFSAFIGLCVGMIGMAQVLEFNDTLMSNLEENQRIWASGAACATGAVVLYSGACALFAAGVAGEAGLSSVKNKFFNKS